MNKINQRIKELEERISNDRIIKKKDGSYICKFCREHPDDCFCNDYSKLELKGLKFYQKEIIKIIKSHSRKDVRHYEDSWDIRPSELIEEIKK